MATRKQLTNRFQTDVDFCNNQIKNAAFEYWNKKELPVDNLFDGRIMYLLQSIEITLEGGKKYIYEAGSLIICNYDAETGPFWTKILSSLQTEDLAGAIKELWKEKTGRIHVFESKALMDAHKTDAWEMDLAIVKKDESTEFGDRTLYIAIGKDPEGVDTSVCDHWELISVIDNANVPAAETKLDNGGISYISNTKGDHGACMKYLAENGDKSGISVHDAESPSGVFGELYATDIHGDGTRVTMTKEKIFYTKGGASVPVANDEITVVEDILDKPSYVEDAVISEIVGGSVSWGRIVGNIEAQTDLITKINSKSYVTISDTVSTGDVLAKLSIDGVTTEIRSGGTGSSTEWGEIGGNLDDQTDLKEKFNTERSTTDTAIATEKSRAETKEGELQTAVASEEARAKGVEDTKLNLPGNAPGTSEPLRLPYYFEKKANSEKVTVTAHTVKLDNNEKKDETFTMDVTGATSTTAGLMTAADKNNLDATKAKVDGLIEDSTTGKTDKTYSQQQIANMISGTGTYRGNYDTLDALKAATPSIAGLAVNDTAVVLSYTPTNADAETYVFKYAGPIGTTNWLPLYPLHTSTFTDEQWAAIESGATKEKIDKIVPMEERLAVVVDDNSSGHSDRTYSQKAIEDYIANSGIYQGNFPTRADLIAFPTAGLRNNDTASVLDDEVYGHKTTMNKWTGTEWKYLYEIHTSTFTDDQWAAITSGATEAKINQIETNKNNITAVSTKVDGLIADSEVSKLDKTYSQAKIEEMIEAGSSGRYCGSYATRADLEGATFYPPVEIGDTAIIRKDEGFYELATSNMYAEDPTTHVVSWQIMYPIHTESFTTEQMAAIDSGATETKINQIQTNTNKLGSLTSADIGDFAASVKQVVVDMMHPIGSLYFSTNDINPGSFMPGTTWELYSKGTCLVGMNPNDADYKVCGNGGGSKTIKLEEKYMPSHSHTIVGVGNHNHGQNTGGSGGHSHTFQGQTVSVSYLGAGGQHPIEGNTGSYGTSSVDDHSHSITADGGHSHDCNPWGRANPDKIDIRNPYIVVAIWKRMA